MNDEVEIVHHYPEDEVVDEKLKREWSLVLSPQEENILELLRSPEMRDDVISLSELCRALHISKTKFMGVIKSLEKRGFLILDEEPE